MCIIRDERNRQLSEVEFEGSGDDVDVLVGVRGDISLLSVCGAKRSIRRTKRTMNLVTLCEGKMQFSFRKKQRATLTSIKGQLDIFNQLTEA